MAENGEEPAAAGAGLTRDQAETLGAVVDSVNIAPLGRNYYRRFREVAGSVEELCEQVPEEGISPERLREFLDPGDADLLSSLADSLRTFGEDGVRRQGEVEPYTTAREDAARLDPMAKLLKDRLA